MPAIVKILIATFMTISLGLLATLTADRVTDQGQRIMRLEDKIGLIYEMNGKLDLIIKHFHLKEK